MHLCLLLRKGYARLFFCYARISASFVFLLRSHLCFLCFFATLALLRMAVKQKHGIASGEAKQKTKQFGRQA
jgi:hypothetical protein